MLHFSVCWGNWALFFDIDISVQLKMVNMKEIVDWLVSIERMTRDIYRKAAELFKADKDFHRFLIHLAEDEETHYQLMKRGKEYFRGHEILPSAVGLDPQTKQKVEKPLMECLNTLSTGVLPSKDIFSIILLQ